jgi:hypothetical protein
VIQVSPPIQSIETPEARQSASLSPGREKAEKKEGPGAFAKLLAGLLRKTGKQEAGFEASGGEKPGTGGKPGKTRSGGAPEDPAFAEAAGEALGSPDGLRKGKNRGAALLRGPAEGAGQKEALSKKEKARAKSPAGDGPEEELAAEAAAELARSVRTEAVKPSGGVPEGEAVKAGGEETPDAGASFGGDAVSLTLAEAAGQDRSAGKGPFSSRDHAAGQDPSADPQEQELFAGELSRYAGEAQSAGTSGAGKNARSPVRETAGKDGRNPLEVRVRDRRRERSNPEAGDIRAGAEGVRYQAEAGKGEEASGGGGRETELTVELRPMGKTQAEISAERENRPVQSFQNMLARELHENLNGDIVRHASVMLRDGGEGTIRLSLRPETLGSVKIRLEITENKITGRITVESGDAFRAFEQELHSLEQSFRDSGFDGASLEMAFASDGQEGGRQDEADSLFSGRLAALRYDAALSGDSESPEEAQWPGIRPDSQGRPLVNMLV